MAAGALLTWLVARARGRSPGRGIEGATDAERVTRGSDPLPTGFDGNVRAVTNEWVPARQRGLAGFGAAVEGAAVEQEAGGDPTSLRTSVAIGDLPLAPEGRLSGTTLLGVAAIVGLLAIGLGTWAFVSRGSGTTTVTVTKSVTQSPPGVERAISLLVSQRTQRIPLAHSVGRIVLIVGARGQALLVVDGLAHAPVGKSYQAWVIPPGKNVPISAAVFTGADIVVPLKPVVAPGAIVAVTLERAGGARGPSHAPKLVAKA
jgi:hypothetical protein